MSSSANTQAHAMRWNPSMKLRVIRLHGIDSRFGSGDLCLGLINSRERPLNPRVLQFALPAIVFNGCFGGFYRRGSLRKLCLIIVVLKFDQDIAGVHALIV